MVGRSHSSLFKFKIFTLNKLISEEVFFNEFADKINLSNSYNSSSLSDMSMGIYKNPEYKNAFYSKGALAVFLLELKLFSFSKGEITFLDLLNNEMPEMDEQAKLELNNLLFDLENELVETKDSFDYNEYFKDFGFKYSEKEIQIEFNKKASLNEKNLWLKFNNK